LKKPPETIDFEIEMILPEISGIKSLSVLGKTVPCVIEVSWTDWLAASQVRTRGAEEGGA
jgi:hypothetical protein